MKATFTRLTDFDLDDLVTLDAVAEACGARRTLVAQLVRSGVLEAVEGGEEGPLVPRRTIIRLRRMQRLRRDLGVNFAGAGVILDLVERIQALDRELAELRRRAGR
jgi:chaperone modulatory protein CbpM